MEKISSFRRSNNSVGKSGDNSSLSSSFILGSFLPLGAEGRDTSVDVSLLIGFPKKKSNIGGAARNKFELSRTRSIGILLTPVAFHVNLPIFCIVEAYKNFTTTIIIIIDFLKKDPTCSSSKRTV